MPPQTHVRQRGPNDILIKKSESPPGPTKLDEPWKQWQAKGNQSADLHAKQAVCKDAVTTYRHREKIAEKQEATLERLRKYHQYLIDIQTEVLKVEQPQKKGSQASRVAAAMPASAEAGGTNT